MEQPQQTQEDGRFLKEVVALFHTKRLVGFDYSASFIGHGRYIDCPVEINGVTTPTKGWIDDVGTAFAIEWMKLKCGEYWL